MKNHQWYGTLAYIFTMSLILISCHRQVPVQRSGIKSLQKQSANRKSDTKNIEEELHSLGVLARERDKADGDQMAADIKSDIGTALLRIGFMTDKHGEPLKTARKCFDYLMSLPEERKKYELDFFIDGYMQERKHGKVPGSTKASRQ